MAIARCPHCRLPLTTEEARRPVCPSCAVNVAPRAAPPAVATAPPPPARPWWIVRLACEGLLVAMGGGMLWYALSPAQTPEPPMLAETAPAPAAPKQVAPIATPVETPPDEAEPPVELEPKTEPEPPRATAKWRAPAPWRGPVPRHKPATTHPTTTAKKSPARVTRHEAIFGTARLLDRPDGEFTVPDLRDGQRVQLLGRVGTLRIGAVGARAVLDAARLEARTVICGGPIGGRATVRLVAPDGAIEFRAPIAGEAWVAVRARVVTLGEVSDAARVGVVLTRGGTLTFGAVGGRAWLFYRKLAPADPEPEVRGGPVSPDAELRRIE